MLRIQLIFDRYKEPGVISDGFTIPKTICNTIRYYEYYGKVFGGTLLLHRETRKKNKLRRELFSIHSVKILGLRQKKLYKSFYAKNGVPYICIDDI